MGRTGKLKAILLLLLVAFALASLAYAMMPLILRAEKAQEIRQNTEQFRETVRRAQEQATEETKEENEIPVPYKELLTAIREYNQWLYDVRQTGLTGPQAYQNSPIKLIDFGLPDETFGIISIPKMSVEMPLYLGASEVNMANGAAVLAQTSIPIGGDNTNAVIAGHRGYDGYDYFRYIDKLEVGDKVQITNLWETLTYTVSEIQIVSPDDVDAILIQPGRDMITLLTCHPYASGGRYRYLVFCERAHDEKYVSP